MTAFFTIGCADHVFLIVCPAAMSDLIELGTAVRAEYHSRQNRHLTHRREPAPSVTDALDDIKGFLINDCFMGVLENLPLRWIVVELLLRQ